VAVALLQLIEEGKADLDDRVAKHLPEFGTNGKERCTIAHLLTHRGGFPDTGRAVRRALLERCRDWDEAIAYVCSLPAQWEPGSDRGYHPMSGWFIVGELVQRLSGRSLAAALRARVLEPAGIEADGFSLGEPERLRTPAAPVRTNGERGAPPEAEARFWNDPELQAATIPGGGGISRAREVVKLYRALLDGGRGANGRMLSERMVRTATFPHAVGIRDRTFLRDIPWGLGMHLKHVLPSLDDCGATATPGTFGHGGHFLVNTAWGDPGKDLAVCILSNGLAPPRAGTKGVHRISQAVHDVVDGRGPARVGP
jgi:CubicO group peptidase (beta-lactamase class C family)